MVQEKTRLKNIAKDFLAKNFYHKFLFIDDLANVKRIKQEVELCIIKTDFNKSDIGFIKKLKIKNKNIEFWISSNNPSRENVIVANKIGIKTIISSPIDNNIVEDFFIQKQDFFGLNKAFNKNYDYSYILNSKVMIVDDNHMNIELLEEILSKFGLKISKFLKPKEAYQYAMKEKFDLFLLDIMMPEMSGFDLANKIKKTSINKQAPIIFISALSDSHTKIKGYELGSFAYIEKPFDIDIVKSQIFNLLKGRKEEEIFNSAQENFLATIVHDLKTPINAEINALNLLLNKNLGELDDVQEEILQDVLDSTKYMQDMVKNILCKNKMDNNQMNLSKQIYSLTEVVEHCIELTKYILNPRKQKIEFQCETNHPFLPLDFVEIKRAIHNLIINASEHSPIGAKILIRIFEKNGKICLLIQDFGGGIDLKNQTDIFSRYISYANEYKKVGSGLGLYITKKIIEEHNGEIKLESKVDHGTTITILLPMNDMK